jgi:hypothetical protein
MKLLQLDKNWTLSNVLKGKYRHNKLPILSPFEQKGPLKLFNFSKLIFDPLKVNVFSKVFFLENVHKTVKAVTQSFIVGVYTFDKSKQSTPKKKSNLLLIYLNEERHVPIDRCVDLS